MSEDMDGLRHRSLGTHTSLRCSQQLCTTVRVNLYISRHFGHKSVNDADRKDNLGIRKSIVLIW